MSQGIKIIMLISAGLIAVGLIIVYIVPRSPAVPTPVVQEVSSPRSNLAEQGSTLQGQPVLPSVPVSPPQPLSDVHTQQAFLTAMARSFTQRYGTYSGDAAFSNITDLYPVMSQAMLARSQAYIQKQQVPRKSGDPLSVTTTTVLSVQVFSSQGGSASGGDIPFGATFASATVKTQRTSIKGNDTPTTWYQDLSLSFTKEDKVWKVDSATWK